MEAMTMALARDFDVGVVTLEPSHPSPEHHSNSPTYEPPLESLSICRQKAFHPHRGSLLWRGLRELGMTLRLASHACWHKADAVVATSPSFFTGVAGWIVSKVRRIPLIWDVRDVTWSYVLEDDRYSKWEKLLGSGLRLFGKRVAKSAALVSVSNEGIADEFTSLGLAAERVIVTPNGVAEDILELAQRVPETTQNGKRPVVAYAGAIGHYQGLASLLDVAERLPNVRFVLAGDGPERQAIEGGVAKRGLSNLELWGFVSRERVFDLYEESDILFAQLRDLPVLAGATFPSKPFEYMAAGRAIVYAGNGIAADFLEASGCALIARPEDPASIADSITRLLEDKKLARRLAETGRELAPRYRRDLLMQQFNAKVANALSGGVRADQYR